MKVFRHHRQGRSHLAACHPADDSRYIDLRVLESRVDADLEALFDPAVQADVGARLAQAEDSAFQPLQSLAFELPLPRPPKIICMGLNYADHAREGGNARPDYPSFFLRGAVSLTPHGGPIVRPRASTQLDYEAELAVVIGRRARHLTTENALSCVFGYSCFNDGSVRNYQRKSAQWTIGKNFDATGGFGPWVVTADALPEGADGLRIQSRLNGRVMQDASTGDFLWNVRESLAIISECMTLEPGDVVITGTPAGVGYARTPPVWMAPGDVCEVEIEGLGVLRNPIVDEA